MKDPQKGVNCDHGQARRQKEKERERERDGARLGERMSLLADPDKLNFPEWPRRHLTSASKSDLCPGRTDPHQDQTEQQLADSVGN